MRIARVSNYDRDTFTESFVEGVPRFVGLGVDAGQNICAILNNMYPESEGYYKLVPDDYKLRIWEP